MSTSAHPNHDSAAHSVLVVPELFLHIAQILDKADRVKLVYLSHDTFVDVAPLIWEDVDLKHLLLLIPGVSMQTSTKWASYPPPFHGDTVVQNHDTLSFPSSINLARFEVYSPLVKVLRTTELFSANFLGSPPNLGTQASPVVLLPNLERLVIYTFDYSPTEYVKWLSGLLPPNLREIKTLLTHQPDSTGLDCYNHHAELHPEAYLDLIDKTINTCPQLEALQMFLSRSGTTASDDSDGEQELPAEEASIDAPAFDPYIAGLHKIVLLRNLRSLSTSVSEIDQGALQVLGQMPHLETLFLYSNQEYRSQLRPLPINLPDDSFASLKHLRLDRTRASFFQRIVTPVPLFRNLVKANIKIDGFRDDRKIPLTYLPSSSAMKCFGQHTPYLVDLTLDPGLEHFVSLSWPIVNILSGLPLRRLDLHGICFNPRSTLYKISDAGMQQNQPDIRWEHFLAAVPHLEELKLGRQTVTLQELCTITTALPHLRLLSLFRILLNQTVGDPGTATIAEPIVIDCRFQAGSFRMSNAYRYQVARFIHAFRPNAMFKMPPISRHGGDWLDGSWTVGLNAAIKDLRSSVV